MKAPDFRHMSPEDFEVYRPITEQEVDAYPGVKILDCRFQIFDCKGSKTSASRLVTCHPSLITLFNSAFGRQINREAAEPMSAFIMFARDRGKSGVPMRVGCGL